MQGRSPFGENNLDSASNKRADPTESPSWFSSAEKFHPGAYVLVTSSLPKVEAFCGDLQLHAMPGVLFPSFSFVPASASSTIRAPSLLTWLQFCRPSTRFIDAPLFSLFLCLLFLLFFVSSSTLPAWI